MSAELKHAGGPVREGRDGMGLSVWLFEYNQFHRLFAPFITQVSAVHVRVTRPLAGTNYHNWPATQTIVSAPNDAVNSHINSRHGCVPRG